MKPEKYIKICENELKNQFDKIDEIALFNQEKVLKALRNNRISQHHFVGTNGYGYGDDGRDTLNKLFADIFLTESAIVSPHILSGTHAIWLCLSGLLRPKNKVLSITGKPYDTLEDCIFGNGIGSLSDYEISFEHTDLKNANIDLHSVKCEIERIKPDMIYMQRSRGYEWRDALSINDIEIAVNFIRNECNFNGVILLDNCYGEFVEKKEPTEAGVDIIAGSLIKNPGGGIAPTGGYIAGKTKYIDLINRRLTAPSIGGEVGSYAYGYKDFYQGIFLAPTTVKNAIKSSLLLGSVMEKVGYKTSPEIGKQPADIIRAIEFNTEEELIKFIQTVQKFSPVDSHVLPLPWDMPGYENKVIMAAGCFVSGSSIELSADAPIKKPYIAYVQGSLTYEHMVVMLKNLEL